MQLLDPAADLWRLDEMARTRLHGRRKPGIPIAYGRGCKMPGPGGPIEFSAPTGYKKCRDYGTFTNRSDNTEVLRFVANPEDPPCGKGVYRSITWHGRYFNGSWHTGVKASPGHFWRRTYAQVMTATAVLTPASRWWQASPEQARAAQADNAVIIEVLRDGSRNVYVLTP